MTDHHEYTAVTEFGTTFQAFVTCELPKGMVFSTPKPLGPSPRCDKSTRQILLDAIAVIEERGWTQLTLEDDNGRVCVQGALNVAAYGVARPTVPVHAEQRTRAEELIVSLLGESVPNWNDRMAKSTDEVLATLRLVAGKPVARTSAPALPPTPVPTPQYPPEEFIKGGLVPIGSSVVTLCSLADAPPVETPELVLA